MRYSRAVEAIASLLQKTIALFDRIPYSAVALAARVFPSVVFWQSGQTKVDGWHVTDGAVYLFREEYRLPLLDPVIAAHLAAFAEHFFPFLLVVGLATRFSAFGLLVMTLIIQIFVYPGAWPTHGTWIACFLILVARGPGAVSLDHLFAAQWSALRSKSPSQ